MIYSSLESPIALIIFIVIIILLYNIYTIHINTITLHNNTNQKLDIVDSQFINNNNNLDGYYIMIVWSNLSYMVDQILQKFKKYDLKIYDVVNIEIPNKSRFYDFYLDFYWEERIHINKRLIKQKGFGPFTVILFKDPNSSEGRSLNSKALKLEIRRLTKSQGKWLVHSSINYEETSRNIKVLKRNCNKLKKRWKELPNYELDLDNLNTPHYIIT